MKNKAMKILALCLCAVLLTGAVGGAVLALGGDDKTEEHFASKNKKAILHIYNSVNRDIFERYLWEVCDHVVESYGQTLMRERQIDEFDKEIIHLFYKSECFGLVINWLDRKMDPDVQKMITRF